MESEKNIDVINVRKIIIHICNMVDAPMLKLL